MTRDAMTFRLFESVVSAFLSNSRPEVLAIRGRWGVGKTFAWNKCLKENVLKKNFVMPKYAYISLFGVNSISELRDQIFQQTVSKDIIGSEPSLETFKDNITKHFGSWGRKWTTILSGAGAFKEFSGVAKYLSHLMIKNTVVCIDDLERKSKSLDIRDVLGLVSNLKEQNGCKIIFIFNDEFLEGEGKKDYEQFKEKVIDYEMYFNPTVEEALAIGFSNCQEGLQEVLDAVRHFGIKNIRIILKIKKLAEGLLPEIGKYHPTVVHQILYSMTLFAFSYYQKDVNVPDFNYIKKLGEKLNGLAPREGRTPTELSWDSILIEYGYGSTDQLDLVIADYVETGILDLEGLTREAEVSNSSALESHFKDDYKMAWSYFYNSFNIPEEEVITRIYEVSINNTKYLNLNNLSACVRLFRECERNELATELIDAFIIARADEPKVFDLSEYPFAEDITDEELIDKFDEQYTKEAQKKSLLEVLNGMLDKRGWSVEDETVMAHSSVDDYYAFFRSVDGDRLGAYITVCMRFKGISNPNERQRLITENTIKALRRFGGESRINELRIRRYGVGDGNESGSDDSG